MEIAFKVNDQVSYSMKWWLSKKKRLFTLPLFLVLVMKPFHSLTMTCSNVNCLQILLVVFDSLKPWWAVFSILDTQKPAPFHLLSALHCIDLTQLLAEKQFNANQFWGFVEVAWDTLLETGEDLKTYQKESYLFLCCLKCISSLMVFCSCFLECSVSTL